MKTEQKNIALVLSGGGARGLAHIGVIEVLLKNGYRITSISGTSIGSVIGGIYAAGNLTEFTDWITALGKFDIFKLMDFSISKSGFIKGEKVINELKKIIGPKKIEELNIPFSAVAVDINKHEEVVFKSGSLLDAIRASVSIPTVLLPFTYNGLELVDGGIMNPLPLDAVKRNKGDILAAVDLNADIPYSIPKKFKPTENHSNYYYAALEGINKKWENLFKTDKSKKPGYFELINKSIFAVQVKLTEIAVKKHQPEILIKLSKDACDMFEFHRAQEMIEYGRKIARQELKAINNNK